MKINLKSFIDLVSDCQRRDLTINSMAVKLDDWDSFKITKCSSLVIDPFGGKDDLNWHVLRHTSEAFSEDPVRVLRTARFAARYGFNITTSTKKLMSDVVHELNHIPTERIWTEFEKGLMEEHAHKMFEVLNEVEAFQVEVMKPWGHHSSFRTWVNIPRTELLKKVTTDIHIPIRFALIGIGFVPETFDTHRIPSECATLCQAVNTFGEDLIIFNRLSKNRRLDIIMNMRALTNQKLINDVFSVLEVIFDRDKIKESRVQFANDFFAIKSVDSGQIASECSSGEEIKTKLFNARLEVMN